MPTPQEPYKDPSVVVPGGIYGEQQISVRGNRTHNKAKERAYIWSQFVEIPARLPEALADALLWVGCVGVYTTLTIMAMPLLTITLLFMPVVAACSGLAAIAQSKKVSPYLYRLFLLILAGVIAIL